MSNRCKSCNTPWIEHLGIESICKENVILRQAFDWIQRRAGLTRADMEETERGREILKKLEKVRNMR
jgi:hypothetical protein